jgi:hypothetical protein
MRRQLLPTCTWLHGQRTIWLLQTATYSATDASASQRHTANHITNNCNTCHCELQGHTGRQASLASLIHIGMLPLFLTCQAPRGHSQSLDLSSDVSRGGTTGNGGAQVAKCDLHLLTGSSLQAQLLCLSSQAGSLSLGLSVMEGNRIDQDR